jgi:hypothetical protein
MLCEEIEAWSQFECWQQPVGAKTSAGKEDRVLNFVLLFQLAPIRDLQLGRLKCRVTNARHAFASDVILALPAFPFTSTHVYGEERALSNDRHASSSLA